MVVELIKSVEEQIFNLQIKIKELDRIFGITKILIQSSKFRKI